MRILANNNSKEEKYQLRTDRGEKSLQDIDSEKGAVSEEKQDDANGDFSHPCHPENVIYGLGVSLYLIFLLSFNGRGKK